MNTPEESSAQVNIPKELHQPRRLSLQALAAQDKEKIAAYLYLIFTLLTVSFFGLFALRPAFSTISNLQKELTDSKNVYDALKTKLAALQTLDLRYSEIESDLNQVYDAIPTTSSIPVFTRQIEEIAKLNNVTLNSLSVGSLPFYPLKKGSGIFYSFSFSLDVTGNEQNVNNFISSLISFNRIISIDNIAAGQIKSNTSQTTIAGKAYFAEKN